MTTQSTMHPDASGSTARKSEAASIAEVVETTAPELKATFRRMVESGKTRVTEWKGGFEDGIRERPVQSVLIAAAVGAVIGVMVGRRSR
jgi:ElaB/YqjD/DUF883 family membrane-anchored ribosome-binding protein